MIRLKFAQLKLLVWKNFLLRRRQPIVVLVELIWPLILVLIICGIRRTRKGSWDMQQRGRGVAMPSAGYIPWMQTYVCSTHGARAQKVDRNGFPDFSFTPASVLTNVVQVLAGSGQDFSQLNNIPRAFQTISSALQTPGGLGLLAANTSQFNPNVTALQRELQQQLQLSPVDAAALAGASVNYTELARLVLSDSNTTQEVLKGPLQLCDQLPLVASLCRQQLLANPLLAASVASIYSTTGSISLQDLLNGQPLGPANLNKLIQSANLSASSFRLVFCNSAQFDSVFTFPAATSAASKATIQSSLCHINATQLANLITDLTNTVDGTGVLANVTRAIQQQPAAFSELAADITLLNDSLKLLNDTDLGVLVDFGNYAIKKLGENNSVVDIGSNFLCGSDLPYRNSFNGYNDNLQSVEQLARLLVVSAPTVLNYLQTGAGATATPGTTGTTQPGITLPFTEEATVSNDKLANSGAQNAENLVTSKLFGQISEHLLNGSLKILYSPNNALGNQIIDQMLEPLVELKDLVIALNSSFRGLPSSLAAIIPQVNASLSSPFADTFVATSCSSVQTMLASNRQLCEYIILGRQIFNQPLGVSSAVAKILLAGFPQGITVPELDDLALYTDTAFSTLVNYSSTGERYVRSLFLGLPTEYDLEVLADNEYANKIIALAGLVFTNLPDNETSLHNVPHVVYKIRQNETFVPSTRWLANIFWSPGPCRWYCSRYRYGGFLFLQDLIDRAIQELQTNKIELDPGAWVQDFPYPCFLNDRFASAIASIMPLVGVLGWILSVAMLIKNIVYEKENRLKEVMKVMGLDSSMHWAAWFFNSFVLMVISATTLTLALKYGEVLKYSNVVLIWLYLVLFCISTITFCFLVSMFFSRANLAACCGAIIYFGCYLPSVILFIRQDVTTYYQKCLACLLAPTAFGLSTQYVSFYETQATGMQWDNLSESPLVDDDFSFTLTLWFMVIDTIIYSVLVWYLDNVMPGQYGIPRVWYFPFTKSYWLGPQRMARRKLRKNRRNPMHIQLAGDGAMLVDNMEDADADSIRSASPDCVAGGSVPVAVRTPLASEDEPKHLKCGVSFHNLVKSYDSATGVTKLAVDDLCLNFYEGQITSFLGHNGAGKTTTMSVLTGMYPPTSGTAYVYGHDIRTEINDIRRNMGICPQHNVLFDRMTVAEHLEFYAQVKGVSRAECQQKMSDWLAEVGLSNKRDCLARNLSGGMKRKLSVAIAFVGDSSTVILDEPTAGVDPYSRRAIWDMLVRYRNKGRTIILSTHHMDEADILGDRIAIISNGKLRCVGSSLFLKGQYGEGYTLTMVKKVTDGSSAGSASPPPQRANGDNGHAANQRGWTGVEDEGVGSMASLSDVPQANGAKDIADAAAAAEAIPRGTGECQASVVTGVLKSFVGEVNMVEDIGAELMFNLPASGAHDGSFTRLFTYLDAHLNELGIASYGVSDTTLEEVFLKVSDDGSVNNDLADTGGFFASARRRLTRASSGSVHGVANRASPISSDQPLMTDDQEAPLMDNQEEPAEEGVEDTDGIVKPADLTAGGSGSYQVTGIRILLQQFRALFMKRFHHSRRNRKGFLAQVIIPAVFVALAMVVKLLARKTGNMPSLLLVPSTYPYPKLTPFRNYDTSQEQSSRIISSMKHPCGISTEHFHLNLNISECYSYPAYTGYGTSYRPAYWGATLQFNRTTSYPASFDEDSNTGKAECRYSYACSLYPNWCEKDLPRNITEADTFGGTTLQDISPSNLDAWITDTTLFFRRQRWGALSAGSEYLTTSSHNASSYRFLNRLSRRKAARAWINTKGYHTYPIYLNVLNNAILRSSLDPSIDPNKYGISVYNQPFNKTSLQLTQDYLKSGVDLIISVCIIFAMSFVPASFVLFLIKERTSNAKHLQRLAGVSGFVYWSASYVWDMCNYMVTVFVCILIFLIFDIEVYTSAEIFPAVLVLFIFYGWSITPLMYPATYVFSVPSTAYVFLVACNILVGVFGTLATFILQLFPSDEELTAINDVLRVAFLVFPNYCLGRGLMDLTYQYYLKTLSDSVGVGNTLIPYKLPWGFDLDQIGRNLLAMALCGVFFFLITLMLETKFLSAIYGRIVGVKEAAGTVEAVDDDVDDDVARERRRVMSGRAADDTIVLSDFTKVYGTRWENHCAVKKLSLGVPKGECFGLLGVNGAGKTSTFKMLTGEESVTSGDAFLNGLSVVTERLQVQQKMGYCPQFDALDDLLTGREHLTLYARLRGVPESECRKVVNWAMSKLSLTRYANKSAGSYSGGNKRKLSTAMALIGKPPVIFLDEPTTGMDPKARRFLWTIVSGLARIGHCIILTSHSMEECEALCQRLAIMVNGRFKCLGSPQHLRSKFGNGYTVTVRLTGTHPDLTPVKEFFSETFPGSFLQREHHNMVVYQLPSALLSLSRIFQSFEEVRGHLPIEDYSVSQTTLDQVFIGFASKQTDDMGAMEEEEEDRLSNHSALNVISNPTVRYHLGEVRIDDHATAGTDTCDV
ncbi:phospholipid-transporting ATPase ABCA1-like isoform X1 [Sycon ciliatum]|uniref:phospholipid-transporting ATPase ABCA1-like isoform X1 n=1 Tax=Sycon ciliatum TaxID=27933 RepID=UPI0031F63BD7